MQIDHSGQVAARLEADELPPSASGSLSLADVFELRSQIPRSKKDSPAEQMRACHARLHGVDCRVMGCAQHDGRMKTAPFQLSFSNALRPYKGLLLRRGSAADDAQRQRTTMRLDFVTGTFQVGALPVNVVRVRLRGVDSLDTLGSLQTAPQKVARRAAAQATAAADIEVTAQLDLRAGRICLQLRVGGRVALDFGTAPRAVPCRAAAHAAASSRVRSEQELEQAAEAEAADAAEIRESWRLAQQLASSQLAAQRLEQMLAERAEEARQDAEARAASEAAAAKRLTKQQAWNAAALRKARENEGEWRARAADLEEDLYEERRKPDRLVRSANEEALATRAEAERRAKGAQAAGVRLNKGNQKLRAMLERERTNRKAAEGLLFEEREAQEREKVDALRRQEEEVRERSGRLHASNQELAHLAAVATGAVEQLQGQLQRARKLRGSGALNEVERLEAELATAQHGAARANSLVTSLRRNQSAAQVTELRDANAAETARAKTAEECVRQHEAHLEVVEEEKAEAEVVAKRAAKAHAIALKRGREAKAEAKELELVVSTKNTQLDTLARQLAQQEVAAMAKQVQVDGQLHELWARLHAGDQRTRQMQMEMAWLVQGIDTDAKEAASKHAVVLQRLQDSEAELAAYHNFQAKEGGAYKDCVRLCYYSLIDKKVPTNQIQAVVTEVLQMVGVHAKALPKRSTAQNMRREMGHVADVVAGALLAKAENATGDPRLYVACTPMHTSLHGRCTFLMWQVHAPYMAGASDDTTKRQRSLAADLIHFRLGDGTLRTLCIGLSCMSSGTATAKVDRYAEKMAQVQAAARLSVPTFHSDTAAFDRVTLLDLIKNWCSDRCITERNAAKLVEERKAKEARAREGGRQLAELRVVGCTLRLSVGTGGQVGCTVALCEGGAPPPADAAKLATLEAAAQEAVAVSMEVELPAASKRQLIDAEMARVLGGDWWIGLSASEQHEITHVWAATCNAHRWVNVGNGFDEGIKEAFDAITAERAMQRGEGAAASSAAKGGAPWDQLVYELTKMLCMNARKMNVAIGQDLLGQQVIELGKDPAACIHTRLKVIVGERFLVTYTNAVPAVALESELTPEAERLSAMMEVRRVRKSGEKKHNRLEESVLEHYKDPDEYDALRVKAIVGHYLLHPFYLSTYHIRHVLELNKYAEWVLQLLDRLIDDPAPLLAGDVHALQYWNRPLQHEPLLVHAHHTPQWGNANFLRMLKAGLEHARIWTVRHSEEHLSGGVLDYESMQASLAAQMWHELESHPIDNLAAERTLALDCYLTRVLGTRLRVGAREAMVKWSMNVKRVGGGLELDSWSKEQVHKTLKDAMWAGRRCIETEHKESARLHEERLPALRANEQKFRVAEEKKAAVLTAFRKMREEGREVRCVGAMELLTAKQVQVQLALRHFLDGLSVRRSGKDGELRPLLEVEVAKEVAAREAKGEQAPTKEAEVARLRLLGFGPKARVGGGRQQRTGAQPQRTARAKRANGGESSRESSGESSDESSDESESESEEEGEIDIDDLLQKEEDVFEVEKLLEWRQAAGGGREFLVKWKGYSTKDTTWEPEANILEKGMIKQVLKKPAFGQRGKPKKTAVGGSAPQSTAPEPAAPEPTRARSSRAGAHAASEAARRANQRDAESDRESEGSESKESEAEEVPTPRAVPVAPGKRQKAAPPHGQAKRAKPAAKKQVAKKQKVPTAKGTAAKHKPPAPPPEFDSSDEEVQLDQRSKAAKRVVTDSSDDEL